MSSADYDLDSSGGLMPKIQALIAPPESDETSKPNKKREGLELHPYYKRPGKGHNRDCCDACSEGGNLICCDKCPASFHLACHDPPLDDEDIPLGQWLCHKCRVTAGLAPLKQVLAEKRKKNDSENVSEATETSAKEEPTNDMSTRGRSRTSSTASMESNKSRGRSRAAAAAAAAAVPPAAPPPGGPITTASVGAGPDTQSALETLIAAAYSMNPKQFDLPREMVLPINFPGTDRAPTRGKKASAAKRSRTLELDNGLVPLPAKTCFECRKSCKRAPLLACDYCPLLFHLDCLDPPLTSLPCGRWMCPNHVEQAIDEKLLTSLSVTRRVALWDKYTGPIDHDAVKTEFLQKARRQNPPFRYKVKLAPRNRAKVPNSVKEMYKNRPPLIPTLRDVLRENEISARMSDISNAFEVKEKDSRIEGPTETEQEEWLSGIIALQTSIACHLGSKKRKKSESSDQFGNHISVVKAESLHDDNEQDKSRSKCRNVTRNSESEFHISHDNFFSNGLSDDCGVDANDVEVSKYNTTDVLNGTVSHVSPDIQNGDSEASEGKNDGISEAVSDFGTKPSSLAFQREEDKNKFKRLCMDRSQIDGLSNLLQDSLDCSISDKNVEKLDERLIRLLALQRLQQLTSVERPLFDANTALSRAQTSSMLTQPTYWPSSESGLQPRALLTPLNGSQPPMPMYYRVMEIGTGGDMDICLSYYGHCNYVTAKHAVIICDEVNRHYELMNYSEHGTTVDNVLYSCDFSEKTPVREQPLSPSPNTQHQGRRSGGGSGSAGGNVGNAVDATETEVEVPPLVQKIRAIVDKRRGVVREEDIIQEPCKMPANIGKVDMKCSCRSSSSSLIGGSGAGWEGTALLNHGSFIKFGCIQFTFSVLNSVAPIKSDVFPQECSVIAAEQKGPIPSRILKRERDSTSSSTLTVSPSPPPDKSSQSVRQYSVSRRFRKAEESVRHYSASSRLRKVEDEEDKEDVNNDDSDREDNEEEDEEEDEDDNGEEEANEQNNEAMEIEEAPTEGGVEDNSMSPQSNCIANSSGPDITNCVGDS